MAAQWLPRLASLGLLEQSVSTESAPQGNNARLPPHVPLEIVVISDVVRVHVRGS